MLERFRKWRKARRKVRYAKEYAEYKIWAKEAEKEWDRNHTSNPNTYDT